MKNWNINRVILCTLKGFLNAQCLAILAGVLLIGCARSVNSISQPRPLPQNARTGYPLPDDGSLSPFEYRGELNELDVLGIDRNQLTSEAEIQRAVASAKPVRLRQGSSILLIQSGALFPDGPMISELGKHFSVAPFSGLPPARRIRGYRQIESFDSESYAKSLRLAAARGGNDVILCYWGILESDSQRLPTKVVSWVPLVNWVVPDETQHVRLRVKVSLVDVRSGNWTVFSPAPTESDRISVSPRRGATDQKQVDRLKQKAYEAAVKELVSQHADIALAK
jgi:hypothetical protein